MSPTGLAVCFAVKCREPVVMAKWFCPEHWGVVPPGLKGLLADAYDPKKHCTNQPQSFLEILMDCRRVIERGGEPKRK